MDGTAPPARKCQQRPASLYTASYMGETEPQQRAPARSLDKLPRTLSAVNAARALRLHPPPPPSRKVPARWAISAGLLPPPPDGEQACLRQCHPSNNAPFLPARLHPAQGSDCTFPRFPVRQTGSDKTGRALAHNNVRSVRQQRRSFCNLILKYCKNSPRHVISAFLKSAILQE